MLLWVSRDMPPAIAHPSLGRWQRNLLDRGHLLPPLTAGRRGKEFLPNDSRPSLSLTALSRSFVLGRSETKLDHGVLIKLVSTLPQASWGGGGVEVGVERLVEGRRKRREAQEVRMKLEHGLRKLFEKGRARDHNNEDIIELAARAMIRCS